MINAEKEVLKFFYLFKTRIDGILTLHCQLNVPILAVILGFNERPIVHQPTRFQCNQAMLG